MLFSPQFYFRIFDLLPKIILYLNFFRVLSGTVAGFQPTEIPKILHNSTYNQNL